LPAQPFAFLTRYGLINMKLTDDMLAWIKHNAEEDTSRLLLRHGADPVLKFCIMQIGCRRQASRKLPDTLRNQRFQFPTALSAEQCTSDALANFHASLVHPGETVLDMTAGLGIDAFHIAATASHVTAIDMNPDVAEALGHNAEALGVANLDAVCADSVAWLRSSGRKFDTIFIDPARRGQCGRRLFALADCSPDITVLLPMLRQYCHRLIVKASPMLDASQTLRELPDVKTLYVTGTRHECKELVAVCDFAATGHTDPEIAAMTADGDGWSELRFTTAEEHVADVRFADPEPGMILYEPYPTVLKSGAFRIMCARYGCAKLHTSTHLYISTVPLHDFPGIPYVIETVIPFNSGEIKRFKDRIPSASVATRNFILSADELRRKLKLKEDSHRRIIGTTSQSGRILIAINPLCEPN